MWPFVGAHFLYYGGNNNQDHHSFPPWKQSIAAFRFYIVHILFFSQYCSQSAVEYSKEFVTSVVVGKDVVPRIGLHQMETLRHDLINALQKSRDPKVFTNLSSYLEYS